MCVLRRDDEISGRPFSCASIALPPAFSIFDGKGGAVTAACGVGCLPPYVNTRACYSICEMRARVTAPGYGSRSR